ncbi:MAG TPA: porin [Burkholderiaceae bacterium]|nr:porin [Burkholderiaceae bacterium]
MKKSLLAVAVAAALPAMAQAQGAPQDTSVVLTGILKTGIANTRYQTVGAAGTAAGGRQWALIDGSSRFIIRGSEGLGGGLRALFQVDTRFRMDDNAQAGGALTSQQIGTGATFVGLEGGFGRLLLGKQDLYYTLGTDEFAARAVPLTHWNVGILSYVNSPGGAIASASRTMNAIRYDTPKFGGFGAGVAYSFAPFGEEGNRGVGSAANRGDAWMAELTYAAGPIFAGAGYWRARTEGAVRGGQEAVRATAKWNFGIGSVGLTWDRAEVVGATAAADAERDAFSVPLTFQAGPGTILATYTSARRVKTGAGATLANTDATLITVGYDYPLSRRTSVGVSYARLDNKAAGQYALFTGSALANLPAPVAGQDVNQFYLGLRHVF